jgi:heat shock protein HslJ
MGDKAMMNKQIFSVLLTAALMAGCASTNASASGLRDADGNTSAPSSAGTNTASPSTIEENEWKLIEVYINGEDTLFRRDTLPKEPGNLFTLTFGAELLSGMGAPNRYSAPYAMGDNQSISVMPMRSTMMAALFEPEKLNEHDFFTYLQNACEWKQVNNNLELLSKTQNGGEVRLVFSL